MSAISSTRKAWLGLGLVLMLGFGLLGFFGREVYRRAPPIPQLVITEGGHTLMTHADILDGQQVWQSTGGQQIGSIWGHGAYQAPDWSADWLHREATSLLDVYARHDHHRSFDALAEEQQNALEARLKRAMRTNRFDASNGTLVISDARAEAMAQTAQHYQGLFGDDPAFADLRDSYALHTNAVPDAGRREKLTNFFFWTAWAAAAERPDSKVSYTNNWPHDPLVGNSPSSANILWSIISVVLLLGGVGGMVWYQAFRDRDAPPAIPPNSDPLAAFSLTPSMRAVAKYCVAVVALFVVQVALGALTAHYTIEGNAVFGIPLGDILPYAVTRTWHIQTAMFWIATAFLAAGLFLAPTVGGKEPRCQKLGVNVLFGALLVVVVGSLAGEWLASRQVLDLDLSFWVGTQGYEYIDLGRAWQIGLFGGLVLWAVLMLRALWPALTRDGENKTIVQLFTLASIAIGLLYGAGFFYSSRTHLSVAEYWRWWVVHLWVEGFFEVFATAALAFVFSKLGLVRSRSAGRAIVASTAIFLIGGIPGTFHHLYFSGTPVSVLAVGATFSALEVVPLVLIGWEAKQTLEMSERVEWMQRYKWPLRFFVGVAFWNLVGAGLFGFLINPPIALYYMQGLNTTPVHAHTALFGVYGLLSLGLVLLLLRRLFPEAHWDERTLRYAFWSMNIGLGAMVAFSLLPIGLAQAFASIEHGLWFARSAEFLGQPIFVALRWMRIVGDTIFLFGVASLVWFTLKVLRSGRAVRLPSVNSQPIYERNHHDYAC